MILLLIFISLNFTLISGAVQPLVQLCTWSKDSVVLGNAAGALANLAADESLSVSWHMFVWWHSHNVVLCTDACCSRWSSTSSGQAVH